VPGWLLLCRRPWTLGAARVATDVPDGHASCDELDHELARLFKHHLGRFGGWLFRKAQEGPWRLALEVAEAEKAAGEPADLQSVESLFWWSGDLRFLRRLQSDRAQLAAAFNQVALVTDYHDTKKARWPRRTKGGRRDVRASGEAARGAPTLCDELSGWQSECRGSDHTTCEAVVDIGHATTCDAFCDSQGAWCEAGWDDMAGSCLRSSRSGSSCSANRTNQICRCRRECADTGPWECHEEGCPARRVTCDILSSACHARFSDIWRRPPSGMASVAVKQACPMACAACMCAREVEKLPDTDQPFKVSPPRRT